MGDRSTIGVRSVPKIKMKAKIAEVFESIQGEGIYLGEKQIFIRFYGCNLNNCRFCDTPLNSFKEYESYDLFNYLKSYSNGFHSISLTGGEPLVQKDFLKEFLPLARQMGTKTYLETNGTLPEELSQIIDDIDIIAMDVKLPSSTGLKDFWQEHKRFLKAALKKEVFIKVVICNSTKPEDLKKAINLVTNLNKDIPFILQPNSFEIGRELMIKIRDFQGSCLNHLSDVRIIPQMHKIVGIK